MDEPWRIYLDRLQLQHGDALAQPWARDEVVRRRAHEAYRSTSDALTSAGWDSEDALTLTRGFGQDVLAWLSAGASDPDELRRCMETRWQAWQANDGPSVDHRAT